MFITVISLGILLFIYEALAKYARSRGHSSGAVYIVGAIALGANIFAPVFVLPYLVTVNVELAKLLQFIFMLVPLLFAGVLAAIYTIMAPGEGAVGKRYFELIFNCQECGEEIVARRGEEGGSMLCPHCDEVTSILEDEHSDEAEGKRIAVHPPKPKGQVMIQSYNISATGELDRTVLESEGIMATLLSDSSGFTVASYARLMVDARDWSRARELLLSFEDVELEEGVDPEA